MAVPSRYRESFAEHASIEGIDHELDAARKALRAQERYIGWLEGVRRARLEQIAAGTWPPKPDEGA